MTASARTRSGDRCSGFGRLLRTRRHVGSIAGKPSASKLSAVMLFALFMCVLLVALGAGISSYAREVSLSDATKGERLGTSFLANIVRANDRYDSISRGAGPEGDALVLTQRIPSGVFETRVYKHDGMLVQEYSLAGTPYSPETATRITETDTFSFFVDSGLLSMSTDQGEVCVALRSYSAANESAWLGASGIGANAITSGDSVQDG